MVNSEYQYLHCDVFSQRPFGGNSLAVFPEAEGLNTDQMLQLTQELRHFESIFLRVEEQLVHAQIFDHFGELPFAGHPILGAAAMLHRTSTQSDDLSSTFQLQGGRSVVVKTQRRGDAITAYMDQGKAKFLSTASNEDRAAIAQYFNLTADDLAPLPIETISTGLAYLIVPLKSGLEHARPTVPDLAPILKAWSADFAYLVDIDRVEGRTWNNDGVIEDVATGSAAGPVAAYGVRHGFLEANTPNILRQGRFLGRPSEIMMTAIGSSENIERVEIAGPVAYVGSGTIVTPE